MTFDKNRKIIEDIQGIIASWRYSGVNANDSETVKKLKEYFKNLKD